MTQGGFSVDGIHTLHDLGFCISSRSLSAPIKKSVRKTIPFMSGSYDFSQIYGKTFYEDRELGYVFDLISDSPSELELEITKINEFVSLVHEANIYDDDLPYYHFRGSFRTCEVERDEFGLSASVTVVFDVYPFRISNDLCEVRVEVGDNIITNKGFAARMTVVPDKTMTILVGSLRQTFSGEAVADIALEHGDNTITVTNGGGVIKWSEERI